MTIAADVIESAFERSPKEFFACEADAIDSDVSERNNCGRLAMYMECVARESGLGDYFTDTE